jgi:hypothetical protein
MTRSVVLVAPTSLSARPASFRPEIELLGETTRVLVEQVGKIPPVIMVDSGFEVDPVHSRAMCQIRTAAGAAAYDRGDRQALRPGHPPSLIRAIRKRSNRIKYS